MSIVLMGDIHGYADEFVWRLHDRRGNLRVRQGDTLVCLGDVGLGYGWHRADDLRHAMSRLPCDVVVMRGNHDVRYCRGMLGGEYSHGFDWVEWGGGEVLAEEDFPNILYVPDDGGLFQVEGHGCLFVPGAYSIDKWYRLRNGFPYEDEELLTPGEMERLLDIARSGGVEYVFSHTCPLSWEPHFRDLFIEGLPQDQVDKSMERWMDELLEVVSHTLKGWYFGHFHDDRDIPCQVPARMLMDEVVRL